MTRGASSGSTRYPPLIRMSAGPFTIGGCGCCEPVIKPQLMVGPAVLLRRALLVDQRHPRIGSGRGRIEHPIEMLGQLPALVLVRLTHLLRTPRNVTVQIGSVTGWTVTDAAGAVPGTTE